MYMYAINSFGLLLYFYFVKCAQSYDKVLYTARRDKAEKVFCKPINDRGL